MKKSVSKTTAGSKGPVKAETEVDKNTSILTLQEWWQVSGDLLRKERQHFVTNGTHILAQFILNSMPHSKRQGDFPQHT